MNSRYLPLNMSVVSAFCALKSIDNPDHIGYLRKNDPTLSHIDWNSINFWIDKIEMIEFQNNIALICRQFCLEFILSRDYLLKLTQYGRQSLIANLSVDEIQVFRNAKLLDKNPSLDIVEWWDNLRNISRNLTNSALLDQGRVAEEWTLQIEKTIVKSFTSLEPEWISINSDHYGYDIKSYRKNERNEIYPINIEVKSYSNSRYPSFYLTFNEVSKAKNAGDSYILYLWCIESKKHQLMTVEQIMPHIPNNNGLGIWQSVLISLGDDL